MVFDEEFRQNKTRKKINILQMFYTPKRTAFFQPQPELVPKLFFKNFGPNLSLTVLIKLFLLKGT